MGGQDGLGPGVLQARLTALACRRLGGGLDLSREDAERACGRTAGCLPAMAGAAARSCADPSHRACGTPLSATRRAPCPSQRATGFSGHCTAGQLPNADFGAAANYADEACGHAQITALSTVVHAE